MGGGNCWHSACQTPTLSPPTLSPPAPLPITHPAVTPPPPGTPRVAGWWLLDLWFRTRLPGWLPAPPRPLVPKPRLPCTGQPCPGPHTGCSLAGKDMEPHGPSPTRDEGPPTPGSATKVPPVSPAVGGPGTGGLPEGSRTCPRHGQQAPGPAATPALCSESRRLLEPESQRVSCLLQAAFLE